MSGFLTWMADRASDAVIDLYFTISDLKDIEINQSEIDESAAMDGAAMEQATKAKKAKKRIPIGKQVW